MSTALDRLINSVLSGTAPTFASLPESDRIELTDTLVPVARPFTDEERQLFSAFALHVDTPEKLAAVEQFNALDHPHKAPVTLDADGRSVLPADLLTWCGPADGYHGLQQLMWNCPIIPFYPVETPPEP